jgi:hypothetical protein
MSQFLALEPAFGAYLKCVFALDILFVLVLVWLLFTKHHSFRFVASGIMLSYWPAQALLAYWTSAIQLPGVPGALGMVLLPWLVHCAIWVAYLQRSHRVRVTFENTVLTTQVDAASPSPPPPPPQTRPTSTVGNTPPPFKPVPPSTKPTITTPMPVPSQQTITVSEDAIEDVWAKALAEYQGSDRKPGLWAKSFAEADGNESLAQATYLKTRAAQLEADLLKERSKLESELIEQALREAESEHGHELEKQASEKAAYDLLPKGECPNSKCCAIMPMSFKECPKCDARFGEGVFGWKLIPLDSNPIESIGRSNSNSLPYPKKDKKLNWY